RDQSAHDPGLPCRSLSWHGPASPSGREWLARPRSCRVDRRARGADSASAIPAPVAYRDLRVARNLLQAVLLSPPEDRLARCLDGEEPADDAPPLARGRRVFPIP